MNKQGYTMLLAFALFAVACHSSKKVIETMEPVHVTTRSGELQTKIFTDLGVKTVDSVIVTFTVTNKTSKALRFCKWETPFEPHLGKYFEVKDKNGKEAEFKGAMARRVMPPPPDAYIEVPPQGSVTASVNLAVNYTMTTGRYSVTYIGGGVSGLNAGNTVQFNIVRP